MRVQRRVVRQCEWCDNDFASGWATARWCPDCRFQRQQLVRDKPRAISQCAWCDHDFEYHPNNRTTYCSSKCAAIMRWNNGQSTTLDWRECKCGTRFIRSPRLEGGRVYCSSECGLRFKYANYVPAPTMRTCACGQAIAKPRVKCDTCVAKNRAAAKRRGKQVRRARKLAIAHEAYTLTEIAMRDGNRCGLCRKRVAMRMVVPHPRAPTIDHILPLSQGGDDTKANVQLAHFACNTVKSTHVHPTDQLRLVG